MTTELQAAGVQVMAITPEPVATAARLKQEMELPWIILSDPQLETIRAFGIFHADEPKGRAIPYPATYLIAQDGVVKWRYIGRDTKDRPRSGQIKSAVNELADKSNPK